MKCKLVAQHLRVFSKAVRLFSKLATEVLIIADRNKMKLQSLNEHKTAFVEILFEKQFFASYECEDETKCKLFMKSLILVFRVLNIDKIANSCTLIMDESMPRIIFEMKLKSGVNREYFLPYMESNQMRYNPDTNPTNPSFKVGSKLMSECLQNFSNDTKDVSLWLTTEQILFKSYFDDIEEQNIMTSFAYKSRDFQNYVITNEISVTFNLKDLKNFIDFATFHDQKVDCYFEASGKPIHFIVNTNEFYSAKLMLATHDFPEDYFPVPPSLPNVNTQNQSLLSSGNLSVHCSAQSDTRNSVIQSFNPECILNTSVSNNESNSFANMNLMDSADNDDPFPEDDNIIDDILSQMPNFSADNVDNLDSIPSSETIARLSGIELKKYHMSVLYDDDDDANVVTCSQDILVPESDEEQ